MLEVADAQQRLLTCPHQQDIIKECPGKTPSSAWVCATGKAVGLMGGGLREAMNEPLNITDFAPPPKNRGKRRQWLGAEMLPTRPIDLSSIPGTSKVGDTKRFPQ